MRDNNRSTMIINEIKKCKTAKEIAVVLRTAFDGIYFKIDRTKQSHSYEMMNLIFVEGIRQMENLEKE